jgi:hypothetical protein
LEARPFVHANHQDIQIEADRIRSLPTELWMIRYQLCKSGSLSSVESRISGAVRLISTNFSINTHHLQGLIFPANPVEMRLQSTVNDKHHDARLSQGGVISANRSQSSIFSSAMGE